MKKGPASVFSQSLATVLVVAATISLLSGGTAFGAGSTMEVALPQFPEVQKTDETLDKVSKLELEGEQYFKQKLYDKALVKWQEAYGMSIEMKFAEGEGRNLTNMGRVFLERGQFPKAKYMGENATEVLSQIDDKKDLGRARVQLARAYFGLDNPQFASAQLAEALNIFTQQSSSSFPDAAELLCLSAQLMIKAGKLKEALQFYDQAAVYYMQANNQAGAVSTHELLANLMDSLGLYVAASEEASKGVAVAKSMPAPANRVPLITAMTTLANTQYMLCEFANARATYEQLVPLLASAEAKDLDPASRFNIDLGYGITVAATGDFDQAKVSLERSLPGMHKAGSLIAQAGALNVLGLIEDEQGQHQKAIAHLNQALDLQGLLTPKQDKLHILILQNLAAVNAHSGNFREARNQLDSAIAILTKSFRNSVLEARTLSSLGEICFKSADPVQAEQYLRKAITIAEKINDDCSLWRDYTILARIQSMQENPVAAKESLTSALSFFRSPQAGPFPSPERLNFPSSREELGQQLVAMVAKQGMAEQALLTCEQLKEESFNDEWHTRGGLVRSEDRDVYNDLVKLRAHLHAAENSSTPAKLITEWQGWLTRFNTLVAQNRNLARLIAPVPSTMVDVMKSVQARHATVVEYLVASDQSVVFTIDPTGRISSTVLAVGGKRLQTQVNALLSSPPTDVSREQTDQRERVILQALYGELIPPSVRSFIPKNADQMVVIIPDGVLFNLPFAALIDAQGKFLVENHLLTMASSMGGFLDSRPRYADALSVLMASSQPTTGMDDSSIIAQMLEPSLVTKLSGRDADAGALQEQGRGKAVVHLTTDTPLSGNPMRSLIPIWMNKEDGGKRVTADRLFMMNIPSDLMVMSATSVNAKDVEGSAVKVFSRGLSYAGVRNVLMSLWVEPDNVRATELVDFYRGKQEGLNQAQSLRKAELLSMAKDPSPRSWAAFQLLGPGF